MNHSARGRSGPVSLRGCMVAAGALLLAAASAFAAQPERGRRAPPPADRSEAMTFTLAVEGPESACRPRCREWIVAQGKITPETPKAFDDFARGRRLDGLAVHLHSGGGIVRSALDVGARFRALGLVTKVARSFPLDPDAAAGKRRFREAEDGVCASACLFLLMGGRERVVPERARVLVHQIWPGPAREDAASAAGATRTYTAKEVAVIQEVNARFAAYLARMGADIGLYEAINSVPPWVSMRTLSREELVRFRVVSGGQKAPAAPAVVAAAPAGVPARPDAGASTPALPSLPPPPQAAPAPRNIPRLALEAAESAAPGATLAAVTVSTRTQDDRRGRYRLALGCAPRPGYLAIRLDETLLGGEEPGERMGSVVLRLRDRGAMLPAASPGETGQSAEGVALAVMFEPLAWDPSARLYVEVQSTRSRPTRVLIAGPEDPESLRTALAQCQV